MNRTRASALMEVHVEEDWCCHSVHVHPIDFSI